MVVDRLRRGWSAPRPLAEARSRRSSTNSSSQQLDLIDWFARAEVAPVEPRDAAAVEPESTVEAREAVEIEPAERTPVAGGFAPVESVDPGDDAAPPGGPAVVTPRGRRRDPALELAELEAGEALLAQLTPGRVYAKAELLALLQAADETLGKRVIDRLVVAGVLDRQGETRATRYRLPG